MTGVVRIRPLTVVWALTIALAGIGLAATVPAAWGHSRPILRWTAPRQIDRGRTTIPLARLREPSQLPAMPAMSAGGGPTHGGIPFTGISCPTASLCVASDLNGNVLTSTTPTRPGTWKRTLVDAFEPLDAVSCPSVHFCIAVDSSGGAVRSSDPTGGPAAWTGVKIRDDLAFDGSPVPVALISVSCGSAQLCVSGDDYPKEIMTATDPTGGPAAWNDAIGIGHLHSADGLVGISCPTSQFCAGVGDDGVYASTDPTGPLSTDVAVTQYLEAIACGSSRLCVAVVGARDDGGPGGVWRSTDPGAPHPVWHLTAADAYQQFAVACHRQALCVATDGDGEVQVSAHPAASQPGWQVARVDGTNVISGVSCPTARLCVAGDTYGYVVVGRR